MERGSMVVSLDFELLWGVFDRVDWREKKEYFLNTRKTVPLILQLFEKYEISCTWATVGMLFNESWEEWNLNIPEVLPGYKNRELSAYSYGKSIQNKETEELCFAPGLIKRINETLGQEVGTHTYSHYYCLEPGQTVESFKYDLVTSKKLMEKFGIQPKSLVFPRNQFNKRYLQTCKEVGIETVRTNPNVWYWNNAQTDSLPQKIFRTGDAYIGLNNKSYKDVPEIAHGIFAQKASRLLRPNSGKKLLDDMRLKRIVSEMTYAAKNKEIYHLWWHPHNFGGNPAKSLTELEFLLKHYQFCQDNWGFKSITMKDIQKSLSQE
jgi:hypothetical protein